MHELALRVSPLLDEPRRWLARAPLWHLWSQIIQTSGARMYGLLISIITLSITARYLGPEVRGILAAATGWVGLVAGMGSLSLGQVIIYLSAGKSRKDWLPKTLGTLVVIVGIITLLAWGFTATGYVLTNGEMFNHLTVPMLVLAFLALPLVIWTDLGLNLLLALDSLRIYNRAQIIGSSVGLAGVFLLVAALGWGIYGSLISGVIAQALIVVLSLGFVFRLTSRISADWATGKALLKGGAKLHLNAIGTLLFTQASVLMVNHYSTPQDTGYYQLAAQLISALQFVPSSISMVAYTLVSKKGPDAAWPEHRRLLAQSIALAIVIAGGSYILAPWLVTLLAGDRFLPAVPLFQWMLLALVGMNFSIVMASQWIGRGLFLQAALLTFVIGFITIVGNYFLLPRYGVMGVVWTMLFVYGFSIFGNGAMAVWCERRFQRYQQSQEDSVVPTICR
jgi:O-antigen/teichoic acid export membrane protein